MKLQFSENIAYIGELTEFFAKWIELASIFHPI